MRLKTREMAGHLGFAALLVAVLALLVVTAAPADAAAHTVGVWHWTSLVGIGLGQKLNMPSQITSYAYDTLAARARPTSTDAPEANVDVLYDTQTYLAAGSGRLNFFSNLPAAGDSSLSNMELQGQLPAGVYFDVWRIFCDVNRVPTATVANTAAGVVNDIQTILSLARGTLTFTQFNKPVGPIPLRLFGNSGAVEGFMTSGRADAAGAIVQAGRMPDNGGWPANGTIRLVPGVRFGIALDFVAGVAVSVDTPIVITLLGVKYRRVG